MTALTEREARRYQELSRKKRLSFEELSELMELDTKSFFQTDDGKRERLPKKKAKKSSSPRGVTKKSL